MQLSRPYQIGLGAICLLAAVWFFALRGHSSGGTSSASSVPAPQRSEPPPTATAPYHGSAPGVAGLTRAIEKARGAVALSEQNAKQLQQKSAEASSSANAAVGRKASAPAGAGSSAAAPSRAATSSQTRHSGATRPTRSASHPRAVATHQPSPARSGSPSAGVPAQQAAVEAQLAKGKMVAILFWSPSGAVDQVVHRELLAVTHALGGGLVLEQAGPGQVGEFGTFTHAVPVYGTPTILLVNRHAQTTELTGLTDSFSLQQAIAEARQ